MIINVPSKFFGDLRLPLNKKIIWGTGNDNGDGRISLSGGEFVFESRIAGNWIEKGRVDLQ